MKFFLSSLIQASAFFGLQKAEGAGPCCHRRLGVGPGPGFPLHQAVRNQNLAEVQSLLGSNSISNVLNTPDGTLNIPLYLAVDALKDGRNTVTQEDTATKIVFLLLNTKGAFPEVFNYGSKSFSNRWTARTPLGHAVAKGRGDIVKAMLENMKHREVEISNFESKYIRRDAYIWRNNRWYSAKNPGWKEQDINKKLEARMHWVSKYNPKALLRKMVGAQ